MRPSCGEGVPGPGGNLLFLLPPGWPADVKLVAGEQEVWAPLLPGTEPPTEPDWAVLLLERARVAYPSARYDELLRKISGDVVLSHRARLLYPPSLR